MDYSLFIRRPFEWKLLYKRIKSVQSPLLNNFISLTALVPRRLWLSTGFLKLMGIQKNFYTEQIVQLSFPSGLSFFYPVESIPNEYLPDRLKQIPNWKPMPRLREFFVLFLR